MGFLENLVGYDPGLFKLPYHLNFYDLQLNPNQLFPWEGAAAAAYVESRTIHPFHKFTPANDIQFLSIYWLSDTAGIFQTMIFRAESGGDWRKVSTPNEAAMSGTQYAGGNPQQDFADPLYAEFYSLGFVVISLNVTVGESPWTYSGMGHVDTNPSVFGATASGNDRVGFSNSWGLGTYFVPPIPYINSQFTYQ